MRLRIQFTITLIVFSFILAVIGASLVITSQQVNQTRTQENLADNIVQGASDLSYLSNDYVLYHQNQQVDQWQTSYNSFSNNVGNLSVNTPEQQSLAKQIQVTQQSMKAVFDSVVLSIGTSPDTNVTLSSIQVSWSRVTIQSQTLILDATQLAHLLGAQADQLNLVNLSLIFGVIVAFIAFLVVIYFQNFRRTLKSISDLRAGTAVIGSGNLDYRLKENKKDEVGELSEAFNLMTANLKSVTASKSELESEIAERKKAEEALKQQKGVAQQERDRLSSLLNSINDEVWFADTEKKFTLANPSAIKEFKINSSEQIDVENLAATSEVYRSDGSLRPVEEAPPLRALKGEVLKNEIEIVRTPINKEIRYRQVSAAPVRDSEGNIIGSISVVRDITELKELQNRLQKHSEDLEKLVEERTKQLKDSERLAAIGATAGMVGHDIRNPLQAITSDVYLIKTELALTPESDEKHNANESLTEIEKNIDYINKIVQDLQDYARPLSLTVKGTNLENLCQEIFSKSNVPKNIETFCKAEKEAKQVMADPDLLKRVISNLVLNAIQAMPKGGKLSIYAYRKEGGLVIEVEDTGEGISDEAKSKLFTPMFTTKSKGQGFGLAVVKRVTEAMNGTVSFESEQGKGTKFTVSLPPPKELNGKLTYK